MAPSRLTRFRGSSVVRWSGAADHRDLVTLLTAFIDLVGGGYVELALELGIATDRIDTVVDFPAIEKYGVKGDGGAAAASAATLAQLAEAIAAGDLVVPIQRTYPLDDVRAAFTELEAGHIAGKIVLIP
jgi:NADPH:quinone reductase-like Zn-dependent oxidoreductase